MPNPWDRPPWPIQGEEECEPIYLAVGRALSQWADVEECISDLFVFFVGQEEEPRSPAIRAYTSIDGVKNRIAMVRSAAEAWLELFPDCPLRESIFEALRSCQEWSFRRNEIAHGATDLPVDTPGATWFLYPGYLTKRRRTSRNDAEFRYTADQIQNIAYGFEKMEVKLWELVLLLREWRSEKCN
jgi:hypothetical protein